MNVGRDSSSTNVQQPGRPSCAFPSFYDIRRLRSNHCRSICDLQEKFRSAIYEYPKVIATTQKLLRASQILNFPVFATTQLKSKLGETCPELGLDSADGVQTQCHADKSAFSMWTPEVQKAFKKLGEGARECVIVGIESHICVTQTTLDLLREGHRVYVIADGVSSCNPQEIGIALNRLRSEGAVVSTSRCFSDDARANCHAHR